MRLHTKNSAARGFVYKDAMLAIRLIAADANVSYTDLAKEMPMSAGSFGAKVNEYVQVQKTSEYASDHLKIGIRTNRSLQQFTDSEIEKIARLMSFDSVAEMVAYARGRFEAPEGGQWSKVTPVVGADVQSKSSAEKIDNLPRYRQAINLLIGLTGKFSGQLFSQLHNIRGARSVERFLDDEPTALKPENKMEIVRQFAVILSKELKIDPPMNPETMLAYADEQFPGQISKTKKPKGRESDDAMFRG